MKAPWWTQFDVGENPVRLPAFQIPEGVREGSLVGINFYDGTMTFKNDDGQLCEIPLELVDADELPAGGYGQDTGPSPLVANGRVIQIGPKPGVLDAHVRAGFLMLRCEAGAGYDNDLPMEIMFNAEDAAVLAKATAIALACKASIP